MANPANPNRVYDELPKSWRGWQVNGDGVRRGLAFCADTNPEHRQVGFVLIEESVLLNSTNEKLGGLFCSHFLSATCLRCLLDLKVQPTAIGVMNPNTVLSNVVGVEIFHFQVVDRQVQVQLFGHFVGLGILKGTVVLDDLQ